MCAFLCAIRTSNAPPRPVVCKCMFAERSREGCPQRAKGNYKIPGHVFVRKGKLILIGRSIVSRMKCETLTVGGGVSQVVILVYMHVNCFAWSKRNEGSYEHSRHKRTLPERWRPSPFIVLNFVPLALDLRIRSNVFRKPSRALCALLRYAPGMLYDGRHHAMILCCLHGMADGGVSIYRRLVI